MTKIGYARAASLDGDNLDEQIATLHDAGCDTVFAEQLSGVAADRTELDAAISALSEGDQLVVVSIDRLSRDFDMVEAIVAGIAERGATAITLDGSLETYPSEA
jgi:DNA invertase Pin-like site-specific DNA recombinase